MVRNSKTVVIIASEGCTLSGIAGPMDMFLQAGVFWQSFNEQCASPYFDIKVVTLDGKPVMANNDVPVVPHCAIDDVKEAGLVIVPSQGLQFAGRDPVFYQTVDWLRHWHGRGAHLASICTGAFVLAATGLLDYRTGTTHWAAAGAFMSEFPNVDLRVDQMVTDEQSIFCGGGMTADLSLALYLVHKYCGGEVALQCSRCSLVELGRGSQLPFAVFMPQKSHKDAAILEAQDWIEVNYHGKVLADDVASRADISTRQFNRRFKEASGVTFIHYVQMVRVEVAKKALQEGGLNIERISLTVGYENVSYFRRLFKGSTGLSPADYRQKFVHRFAVVK